MSVKILRTEDLKIGGPSYYSHNFFVGVSGSGKTTAAASYPSPFIFDMDKGVSSIAGLKGVDYAKIDSIEDLLSTLDEVQKMSKYKTLVFDSMTTMAPQVLKYIAKINGRIGPDGNPDMKKIGIQDYGHRIQWMTNFFIRLSEAPCYTIIIAHEELIKDDLMGAIIRQPSLPGNNLPGQSPVYFDEVYRFTCELSADKTGALTKRLTKVCTVPDAMFPGKTRIRGKLPPIIELRAKPDGEVESLFEKVIAYVNR